MGGCQNHLMNTYHIKLSPQRTSVSMVNEIKYYGCPIINAVTPTSLSKRINDQEE